MLGLDNPLHIAFIVVLLLLVFGAKRLPEMGRSLGAGLRGFRESINGEKTSSTLSPHERPARVDASSAALAPTASEHTAERTPAQPVG
jgi:sec-independent protein translocase protein TatA